MNEKCEHNDTALHVSVYNGHTAIVKVLVDAPIVIVNEQNNDGHTPLHLAVIKGYTDIVKILVDAPRVDVNKKNNNGDTPLYLAVTGDKIESDIIQTLFAAININAEKADTPPNKPYFIKSYCTMM